MKNIKESEYNVGDWCTSTHPESLGAILRIEKIIHKSNLHYELDEEYGDFVWVVEVFGEFNIGKTEIKGRDKFIIFCNEFLKPYNIKKKPEYLL